MATLTSVTNHFPKPKEGFITTLSSTIGVAAATVPLTSTSGLTNGDVFVGIIDPTTSAKQAFTGTVDTAGNQITGVVWTEGTNVGHTVGATVVDYVAATSVGMISKGILVEHNQDGTHDEALITSRTADTSPASGDSVLTYDLSATALKKVTLANLFASPPVTAGTTSATSWIANALPAVSSVTENGNRSASITFASDVSNLLTPGMRLRTSRTVAAPTGAILLNGTTQYGSKSSPSGMTFTDNFTCMGWVKLTAYSGSQNIISRFDGTTGWALQINSSGQVIITGLGTAGAQDAGISYQSVPLNKWVHIAASLNMAGTSALIYIDGVLVPSSYTNGAASALIQAGNLQVGAANGGSFLGGNIAQAAVFNAILSAATIRSYKNQTLSGSETNCVSAYKLDQASGLNDLSANANNLTATGSPTYSTASPFTTDANGTPGGTYDYAIVTKVATTVATVQYPEGCAIPTTGGISTVDYSGVKAPFGMPVLKNRWKVSHIYNNHGSTFGAGIAQFGSVQINVPIGNFDVNMQGGLIVTSNPIAAGVVGISTSTSSYDDNTYALDFSAQVATIGYYFLYNETRTVSVSSATNYYLIRTGNASFTSLTLGHGELSVTPSDL